MKLAFVFTAALAACHGSDTPRPTPRDASAPRVGADAAAIAAPPAAPRYTIEFPAPANTRETTVQTLGGPMPQKVETAELDGITYIAVSGTTPPGTPDGNKPGGQDRVLAAFGASATRDVAIKLGDIDGREVRFAGSAHGILHTYVVGTWMFQAGVVARTGSIDEARAKRFFESLKIHP